MKRIPLTQGKVAIVDDEDYQWLSKYKWHTQKGRYTFYGARGQGRPQRLAQMHRVIMNASKGQEIDHKNGNGLDNRKENLRFCSRSQNQYNQQRQANKSSKYKGVCWNRADGVWQAYIQHNQRKIHLGRFDSEVNAAQAYNNKAKELFGEFAKLNFPL